MTELIRAVVLRLPVLSLPEAEKQAIILALQINNGNATWAAKSLGISLTSMRRKITKHGITHDDRYKKD